MFDMVGHPFGWPFLWLGFAAGHKRKKEDVFAWLCGQNAEKSDRPEHAVLPDAKTDESAGSETLEVN